MYIVVHTYVRRQTDRQTDRLTDWLTDRHTYIHTHIIVYIYICIYIYIYTYQIWIFSLQVGWDFTNIGFNKFTAPAGLGITSWGWTVRFAVKIFPTKPILYFTETMWNHQNPRIYHWTYHIIMNKDILCYPDIFMISQMYVLICSFFLAGSASSTIWSSEVRPPGMRKSIGGTFRWSANPSLQWLKMVMIVNDIISGDWYGELSISDILSY